MAVYTARYPIHTYESDLRGRAHFASLFRFLQDTAATHAIEVGYGLDDMKEQASLWVLSRFLYRAYRTPLWQEELEIETWPSGTERLFALRDWILRDKERRQVGVATSSWVVIDFEKRTPVRIERVAERMDMIVDRRVLDRNPEKLPVYDLPEVRFSTTATFADMDLNVHVNAACYVEWMFEGLPAGFREEGNELAEVEINFNGESHSGDEILIYTERAPTTAHPSPPDSVEFHHSAVRSADDSIVCRARSVWAPSLG